MKKLIAAVLAAALMSTGLCFAADAELSQSNDPVLISLDTIEQIWRENSPELKKLDSTLAVSKRTYDRLKDSVDDLVDAALYDVTMYMQYKSLQNSRDQAECAYEVAVVQREQSIQNDILAAKQDFLTCWQDELNLEALRDTLSRQQARLDSFSEGLSRGYLSQSSYDNLKDEADGLQNKLDGLQAKAEADEITLKAKLGLDTGSPTEYRYPELNGDSFASLVALDPEADQAEMLENSVSLKALQITYDSMKSPKHFYATTQQIADAKLNLSMARRNLETGYTLLSQSLTSQYEDLQNSYTSLDREKEKLDRLQSQYDRGLVSAQVLSSLNSEYISLKCSVQVKESSLYGIYLSYLNMVAGN